MSWRPLNPKSRLNCPLLREHPFPCGPGHWVKCIWLPCLTNQAVQFIQERELTRYTEKTITDKSDYLAEIDQVRQNGYAVDDEEFLPGVKAVATGVGNHRGLPLALWVVGFAGAMENGVLPKIIRCIQQAAHDLQKIMDIKGEMP